MTPRWITIASINENLSELGHAAEMTGSVHWLVRWGIYEPSRLGARLSLLTGRFPITIRAEAMAEARKLTEEKVKI